MKKIIAVLIFFLLLTPLGSYSSPNNDEAIKAYNKGIELYSESQYEQSIESFKRAVKIEPNFYEAYYNLGQVYYSMNKLDEAIENYELALKYEPNDYQTCYTLGEIFYQKGYLSRSIEYLSKVSPSSDLYKEAQEFRDRVIKRQKEVLAQEEAKKQEADKKLIEEAQSFKDIEGIKAPSGVVGDSFGNLFIASYGENRVYKINPSGLKSVYVNENVLKGPVGLAIDKENNVYIANYGMGNILKVSPKGAPYIFTKILKPYCLTVIGNYLFVSEQETNKVMRFKI